MNGSSRLTMLVGLRMAVGASAWATPRLAGKLFGLDADANPQSPYLGRLFGARDVTLAWGVLANAGETRRQWLVAGVGCDLADALAGILGTRAGYLSKTTGVLVTGTALLAAVLGAATLSED